MAGRAQPPPAAARMDFGTARSELSVGSAKQQPSLGGGRRPRPSGRRPSTDSVRSANSLGSYHSAGDRSRGSLESEKVYLTKEEYRDSLLGPPPKPADEERLAKAKKRRERWEQERLEAKQALARGQDPDGEKLDPVKYWQRAPKQPLPPGTCLNAPSIEERNHSSNELADETAAAFKHEDVFMLISTMKKNVALLAFQTEGLRALRALSLDALTRATCLRHKAIDVVIAARDAHTHNEECQILCVEVLSNYAKQIDSQWAIVESRAVQEGFNKQLQLFQNHETIARMLLATIQPVANKPALHGVFLNDVDVCRLITTVLHNFRHNPALVAEGLAVMESLGVTFDGRRMLIDLDLAPFCVSLMVQYRLRQTDDRTAETLVLQGAVGVLCYLCRDRQGCEQVVACQGLLPILNALKVVVQAENLQLRGLVMVTSLVKLPVGREQLERVDGGWQWLTQGTDKGNVLVHLQRGELHNRGWSIGDSPNITVLDAPRCAPVLDHKWNSQRLREFMGVKYSWQHSNIGLSNMAVEHYFELVNNLGLLPFPAETKEAWFQRMHHYEQANEIDLRWLAEREAKGYQGGKRREEDRHIALEVTDDGLLNWPDSRPGSRAASRVSSRGETLVTYSRAESRVQSRSSSRASQARGASRGSLGSAGSGGMPAMGSDHKELTLTMRDVSKLIELQDPSGMGLSGSRPFSRGDAIDRAIFGNSRPEFVVRQPSRQQSRQRSRQGRDPPPGVDSPAPARGLGETDDALAALPSRPDTAASVGSLDRPGTAASVSSLDRPGTAASVSSLDRPLSSDASKGLGLPADPSMGSIGTDGPPATSVARPRSSARTVVFQVEPIVLNDDEPPPGDTDIDLG